MPVYNPASATAIVTVQKNGTTVGSRPAENLIEGTNVTITAADNAGTGAVDVTFAAVSATGATAAPPVGTLSTAGESCVASDSNIAMGGTFNSGATWVFGVNVAVFIPVQVPNPITIYQLGWENSATVAGNVDVGIYDESFSRLVSAGSTAMSGATTIQLVDVADTVLTTGTYFMAMVSDSATATFRVSSQSEFALHRLEGMQMKSAAFPLPSTASGFSAYNSLRVPLIVGSFQSAVI